MRKQFIAIIGDYSSGVKESLKECEEWAHEWYLQFYNEREEIKVCEVIGVFERVQAPIRYRKYMTLDEVEKLPLEDNWGKI